MGHKSRSDRGSSPVNDAVNKVRQTRHTEGKRGLGSLWSHPSTSTKHAGCSPKLKEFTITALSIPLGKQFYWTAAQDEGATWLSSDGESNHVTALTNCTTATLKTSITGQDTKQMVELCMSSPCLLVSPPTKNTCEVAARPAVFSFVYEQKIMF